MGKEVMKFGKFKNYYIWIVDIADANLSFGGCVENICRRF